MFGIKISNNIWTVSKSQLYEKTIYIANSKTHPSTKYFFKKLENDVNWLNENEKKLFDGSLNSLSSFINCYFGFYQYGADQFLAMDFCESGTLKDYIEINKQINHHLTNELSINWMLDMANGLKFLDQMKIVHKNLKPSNIYIYNGSLKIGDISCDLRISVLQTETNLYMSPEVLSALNIIIKTESQDQTECIRTLFTHKSDIWSLGCVFFELLTYSSLFQNTRAVLNYTDFQANVNCGMIYSRTSLNFDTLFSKILAREASMRIDIDEILERLNLLKRINSILTRNNNQLTCQTAYSSDRKKFEDIIKQRSLKRTKNLSNVVDEDDSNNFFENQIDTSDSSDFESLDKSFMMSLRLRKTAFTKQHENKLTTSNLAILLSNHNRSNSKPKLVKRQVKWRARRQHKCKSPSEKEIKKRLEESYRLIDTAYSLIARGEHANIIEIVKEALAHFSFSICALYSLAKLYEKHDSIKKTNRLLNRIICIDSTAVNGFQCYFQNSIQILNRTNTCAPCTYTIKYLRRVLTTRTSNGKTKSLNKLGRW